MSADGKIELSSTARVLISPPPQYRYLFSALIRGLHFGGSSIRIAVSDRQRSDFWSAELGSLPNVSVVCDQSKARGPRDPVDIDDILQKAKNWESRLGTTITRFTVNDRQLGRGFAPGGFRHPRSHGWARASYSQVLAVMIEIVDFWSQQFEEFKPTLVINCGDVADRFASKYNIPYRVLAGSRVMNLHQWAHSERWENPRIREFFDAIEEVVSPVNLDRPYVSNAYYVNNFEARNRFIPLMKETAYLVLRNLYWRAKGYQKASGYYLGDQIRYIWRRRGALQKLSKDRVCSLRDLQGSMFVFYPLHTEPEAALQGLSPEWTFQLEAIISLSRELPAGVLLAVKETQPALGRRPRDFYDQISELKNVRFLNINERGVDVVHAAAAVATITGTAGFEAAVSGKPVISFGKYNQYNFLDHVHVVDEYASLRDAIESALGERNVWKAQCDGARFLLATKRASFDLAGYNFMRPQAVTEEMTAPLLKSLEESLQKLESRAI